MYCCSLRAWWRGQSCQNFAEVIQNSNIERPRLTLWLSRAIRSFATGTQSSGPMKSFPDWFHWSIPLVSLANWPDFTTESESGSRHSDNWISLYVVYKSLYSKSALTVPFLPLSTLWCFYTSAGMMQARQQASSIHVIKHATKRDAAGIRAKG